MFLLPLTPSSILLFTLGVFPKLLLFVLLLLLLLFPFPLFSILLSLFLHLLCIKLCLQWVDLLGRSSNKCQFLAQLALHGSPKHRADCYGVEHWILELHGLLREATLIDKTLSLQKGQHAALDEVLLLHLAHVRRAALFELTEREPLTVLILIHSELLYLPESRADTPHHLVAQVVPHVLDEGCPELLILGRLQLTSLELALPRLGIIGQGILQSLLCHRHQGIYHATDTRNAQYVAAAELAALCDPLGRLEVYLCKKLVGQCVVRPERDLFDLVAFPKDLTEYLFRYVRAEIADEERVLGGISHGDGVHASSSAPAVPE
mmetsp:Transcript_5377/g.15895  ORF Transcript_5377/g.15895 Transcript_5377/m.15895 type:complete len:320 (+) Transcript_5377:503-1462(+)